METKENTGNESDVSCDGYECNIFFRNKQIYFYP